MDLCMHSGEWGSEVRKGSLCVILVTSCLFRSSALPVFPFLNWLWLLALLEGRGTEMAEWSGLCLFKDIGQRHI